MTLFFFLMPLWMSRPGLPLGQGRRMPLSLLPSPPPLISLPLSPTSSTTPFPPWLRISLPASLLSSFSTRRLADPTPSPVADAWIYDEGYGIQTYTLNPVTSASGLKGVMLDVLGSYDAIVVEHRYQNSSSGSYSYVRDIQPDYPWIASVVVFVVVLYCCIRLGAALLCRK